MNRKLFALAAAALAVGAWRAGVERKHQQAVDAAEALYDVGRYAEAKEAFLALEMNDRAADCDEQTRRLAYEAAQALLQQENFDEAKEAFRALGDYRDAAEMITACDFVRAGTLVRDGHYGDAIRLLQELEDYPGAAELIAETNTVVFIDFSCFFHYRNFLANAAASFSCSSLMFSPHFSPL